MRHAGGALLIVLTLHLPACERTAPVETTTVRGCIRFDGLPLSGGRVVFTPDTERGHTGKPLSAEVAKDGCFQLTLGGDPTIPAGWYRVAIATAPDFSSISSSRTRFPLKLSRPDLSGIVRQVIAGRDNYFDLAIDSHPN